MREDKNQTTMMQNEVIEDALTEIGRIVLSGLPEDKPCGIIFYADQVRKQLEKVYEKGFKNAIPSAF